ncbi:MAG: alanine racemase [Pyrinomonadaceae bacterium]|nr:alanine racemase [Pyrinomonadaceae bacterium]
MAANFLAVRDFVGANVGLMAVVKADAYGHGAVSCAKRLELEKVDWFGVALPEEALELRENNIETKILSLGGFWRGQEQMLLQQRITPVIYRIDAAESLDNFARESNQIFGVHVKIDTGMNRLGVRFDAVRDFADKLKGFQNLRVEGLMTHFAAADDYAQNDFSNVQIEKYNAAIEIFREKGFRPTWFDLANSPATIAHKNAHGNLVRLGGILYGLWRDILPQTVDNKPPVDLRPVMSLRSQVTLLKNVPKGESLGYSRTHTLTRDSIIATIPIGYSDGLPRLLSNKGGVIINGVFAPIVGRVSMDLIMLDVSEVPNVKLFDEVVLFGAKDGLEIPVEKIGKQCETISYEITCGISRRVPRRFKPEN